MTVEDNMVLEMSCSSNDPRICLSGFQAGLCCLWAANWVMQAAQLDVCIASSLFQPLMAYQVFSMTQGRCCANQRQPASFERYVEVSLL